MDIWFWDTSDISVVGLIALITWGIAQYFFLATCVVMAIAWILRVSLDSLFQVDPFEFKDLPPVFIAGLVLTEGGLPGLVELPPSILVCIYAIAVSGAFVARAKIISYGQSLPVRDDSPAGWQRFETGLVARWEVSESEHAELCHHVAWLEERCTEERVKVAERTFCAHLRGPRWMWLMIAGGVMVLAAAEAIGLAGGYARLSSLTVVALDGGLVLGACYFGYRLSCSNTKLVNRRREAAVRRMENRLSELRIRSASNRVPSRRIPRLLRMLGVR